MSAAAMVSTRLRFRRLLLVLLGVAGLGCAGWVAGFAWFVHGAMQAAPLPPEADGIVALTGGADRIETALRLLLDGRGRLLLVSGVAHGADLAELTHRIGLNPTAIAPRVTLGRTATTTVGNASETADWAHTHDMHSLIVVTSGYHMARALTEIGRALPEVRLYPMPVLSPAVRHAADIATLRLLAAEYTKFLAADLGLTHLSPTRDGA
jgi:uncharacterized SAM-binding protein YcdF (DUF218 family)